MQKERIEQSKKNRFSKYQSYTIDDIAFICDVSRKTVERWIKEGMAPIDPHTKPYRFMGDVVMTYRRNTKSSRKWDMSGGSYTCFKCRRGVQAKEKSIRKIGAMYHAICKRCSGNVCKTIGKPYTQIRSP